jgi:aryl-alcohol dehydrogenase-like predicted oxidoreductase
MRLRRIGLHQVPEIGLGCMNLSHGYGGVPSPEEAVALLQRAYDLGVRHFDTAALYGFGHNEELVGRWMQPFRKEIHLASKCGMQGVNGQRVIDGRPETMRATLEDSLRRLNTDFIDLYYLHRWDKNNVPLEESVGALADMLREGKIGGIGLSEVSAATLRKAHGIHPVTAVQNEYSLWTQNPEIALSSACQELGVALVAFSPMTRGFFCGDLNPEQFSAKDIRCNMPRFQEPHFSANRQNLLPGMRQLAREAGCTPAQLLLAWLLSRGEHVIPIPGTTKVSHLEDNLGAAEVTVAPEVLGRLNALVNPQTVQGPRYPAATQAEIDTEQFSFESPSQSRSTPHSGS